MEVCHGRRGRVADAREKSDARGVHWGRCDQHSGVHQCRAGPKSPRRAPPRRVACHLLRRICSLGRVCGNQSRGDHHVGKACPDVGGDAVRRLSLWTPHR
nr:hypothetical protein orf0A cnr-region [imported] - Alcaligenes eutrophus [Cupriavidus necator]